MEEHALEELFAEIEDLVNRMFEEEQLTLSEDDWQAIVSLMTYDDLK